MTEEDVRHGDCNVYMLKHSKELLILCILFYIRVATIMPSLQSHAATRIDARKVNFVVTLSKKRNSSKSHRATLERSLGLAVGSAVDVRRRH